MSLFFKEPFHQLEKNSVVIDYQYIFHLVIPINRSFIPLTLVSFEFSRPEPFK